MKFITIISSALLALACPMAALADDFKYDDEPTVEVGGADGGTLWDGETPGVDIEIDDEVPTGVQKVVTTPVAVTINRPGATITIISAAERPLQIYRIGDPAVSVLSLSQGSNVFTMPRGIYIIAGRKYML